jgi:hypothetical protein
MLTLIEAPKERIDMILRHQHHLQRLYDDEWLYLVGQPCAARPMFCLLSRAPLPKRAGPSVLASASILVIADNRLAAKASRHMIVN